MSREMSCNPSIGGIGKGHLVREIDALDGLMGRVIDQSAIHFRVLNRKKGLAVRGIRAQADRDIYKQTIYKELCKLPNLKVIEASIESLLLEDSFEETEQAEDLPLQLPFRKKMKGVWTSRGELYLANRIVLTTGTFLRGRCWQGNNVDPYCFIVHAEKFLWIFLSTSAGRFMRNSSSFEPAAEQLAMQLKKLNFPLGRLKTGNRFTSSSVLYTNFQSIDCNTIEKEEYHGFSSRLVTCSLVLSTPPRLDGRTIDWRRLTPQNSENPPTYFSFLSHHLGNKDEKELICCYKTYTNAETHRIVAKNCHTLPALESGTGRGVGPRYCPSLPSKKF
ncbi:glucose inhibited division protein A subfamily protein [Cardiosporidium cionae]|uniref:Glucose inhibited division protein A subfamily protein n=1 Tax=Cardiosporidium cionae TaxID=476202 RepID=A0ABQ7J992_9APIC|nr:glucose inhibited division protein A subfamily protein [Cardiosporidium cionae]|eukprot:KAF8820225.1 glucose inhibited division protein A subfamily protein [Cardiosporidium cionae]